ncbi:MAG: signal peptidase I [Nocardioides sp.]
MTAQNADDSVHVEEPRGRRQLPLWLESILLLGLALALAILIKALLVQAFYIPSESMEPGLVRNDRILVQKVSYWFGGTPQRGDVVVFQDPGGWLPAEEVVGPASKVTSLMAKIGLYPSGGHLVKRVIGVAGDMIKCCDAKGRISVNGVPLDEKAYARKGSGACFGPMIPDCDWQAGPVPQGTIFVMGDNRSDSADSSYHLRNGGAGPQGDAFVPVDLVVGKVLVVLWPHDHFRWLHRPDDFADVPDASAHQASRQPHSG